MNGLEAIRELSSAREALEIANQQVQSALASVDAAKAELAENARQYLMESPEEELLARAALVYWGLLEVPCALIASVVLGDPKKTSALVSLLPSRVSPIKCRECSTEIEVKSRSALIEAQKHERETKHHSGGNICKACQGKRFAARDDDYAERLARQAERSRALHTMPYRDYLLTEEWLETRNRKLKQARFSCQLCNSGGLLNVHHRTYDRRGYEDMADLIVLCHPCHAKFHGKLP